LRPILSLMGGKKKENFAFGAEERQISPLHERKKRKGGGRPPSVRQNNKKKREKSKNHCLSAGDPEGGRKPIHPPELQENVGRKKKGDFVRLHRREKGKSSDFVQIGGKKKKGGASHPQGIAGKGKKGEKLSQCRINYSLPLHHKGKRKRSVATCPSQTRKKKGGGGRIWHPLHSSKEKEEREEFFVPEHSGEKKRKRVVRSFKSGKRGKKKRGGPSF